MAKPRESGQRAHRVAAPAAPVPAGARVRGQLLLRGVAAGAPAAFCSAHASRAQVAAANGARSCARLPRSGCAAVEQHGAHRAGADAAPDHRGAGSAASAARRDGPAAGAARSPPGARRRRAARGACSRSVAARCAPTASRQAGPVGHDQLGRAGGRRRARVGDESAIVKSISWPTPLTTGMRAGVDGARHALVVEGPQVLERAAAARQDQHVALGPRRGQPAGPRPAPAPPPRPAREPDRSALRPAGSAARRMCSTSRRAAPVGEVTTPMRRGKRGSGALALQARTGPRRPASP